MGLDEKIEKFVRKAFHMWIFLMLSKIHANQNMINSTSSYPTKVGYIRRKIRSIAINTSINFLSQIWCTHCRIGTGTVNHVLIYANFA